MPYAMTTLVRVRSNFVFNSFALLSYSILISWATRIPNPTDPTPYLSDLTLTAMLEHPISYYWIINHTELPTPPLQLVSCTFKSMPLKDRYHITSTSLEHLCPSYKGSSETVQNFCSCPSSLLLTKSLERWEKTAIGHRNSYPLINDTIASFLSCQTIKLQNFK